MSHVRSGVDVKERDENKTVYIDLDTFARDILQGDMEWFERIAARELQKLEATARTTRA